VVTGISVAVVVVIGTSVVIGASVVVSASPPGHELAAQHPSLVSNARSDVAMVHGRSV